MSLLQKNGDYVDALWPNDLLQINESGHDGDDDDGSLSLSPLPFYDDDDPHHLANGRECEGNKKDDYDFDEGNQEAFKDMEAQVAKQLYEMTPQQRNEVFDDVHGVSPLLPESSEFLAEKLHDFNDYIIKQEQQSQTQTMQHEYYARRSIRLRFLRATEFDIIQATNLLQKFINCKLSLFGPSSLFRDITIQQDFQPYPEDFKCLKSGVIQLVPSRDQGGRLIVLLYAPMMKQFTVNSLRKICFFLGTIVSRNVENQRRGVVILFYNAGDNVTTDSAFIQRTFGIAETRHCVPFRTVAHHMCVSDFSQKISIQFVMYVIGHKHRVRFRAHYGNHGECLSALQTHGIPCQQLPITKDGQVCHDNHLIWLEKMMQQERQRYLVEKETPPSLNTTEEAACNGNAATGHVGLLFSSSIADNGGTSGSDLSSTTTKSETTNFVHTNNDNSGNKKNLNICIAPNEQTTDSFDEVVDEVLIDLPRYYDVLFGRGRMVADHPGNQRLHQLVEIYYERYEKSSKLEKVDIAFEIVSIINKSTGRFLRSHETCFNQWVEVSDEEARDKVSSTFRNRRAQQLKIAKQQGKEKGGARKTPRQG